MAPRDGWRAGRARRATPSGALARDALQRTPRPPAPEASRGRSDQERRRERPRAQYFREGGVGARAEGAFPLVRSLAGAPSPAAPCIMLVLHPCCGNSFGRFARSA